MVEAADMRITRDAILVQRDRRADGGARKVRVTRSDILISRRFNGVDMMIAVPVPAYKGVALVVVEGREGVPCYRLSLAHHDRDLDVLLGETQDSDAAADDWKYWADWLGLPRLASDADGLAAVGAARGLRPAPARRNRAAVRWRRPRFLARRKIGDEKRLAAVFAGEREIVSYE